MKKKNKNLIESGKHSLIVNEEFFKRLNPKVDIDEVRRLFQLKLDTYTVIDSNADLDREKLKSVLTNIEFKLQEQLGVSQDINYHRWWEVSGCTCPKLDNADRWGTPYNIFAADCIWHGKKGLEYE